MNNKIPILDWYLNGKNDLHKNVWEEDYINSYQSRYTVENIKNCKEGKSPYGHDICINLLNAFEDYNIYDENEQVTQNIKFLQNRAVIFNSKQYHKSSLNYGDNIDNGRLTLNCFINFV